MKWRERMIWVVIQLLLVGAIGLQINQPETPIANAPLVSDSANSTGGLDWGVSETEQEEQVLDLSSVLTIGVLSLRAAESVSVGPITIWNSGEVSYPTDGSISELAMEFWEAMIAEFPDIEWGPASNEWFHIVYKTNLGQPIVTDIEFPSTEAAMSWLDSIGATNCRISKMGADTSR